MKLRLYILLLIIAVNLYVPVFAQQIEASSSIEKSSILIGDQIKLDLNLTCPATATIIWPDIRDTLITEIEVIRKTSIDTTGSGTERDLLHYNQQLIITSFDSGFYAIPPFIFLIKLAEEEEYQAIESEALLFEVQTIAVDMEADIKDIAPTINVPLSFAEIWPWLLGGILLILLLLFIIYFLRKRKRAEPLIQIRKKPVLPPHQVALDALQVLKEKKLWQQGRIKDYHTGLTDIIRNYIAAKFNIHAVEMVTFEIVEAINTLPVSVETKDKLKQMLELADLVKFAKEHPLPADEEKSMNYAIDFVRNTIFLVEEETKNNTERNVQ